MPKTTGPHLRQRFGALGPALPPHGAGFAPRTGRATLAFIVLLFAIHQAGGADRVELRCEPAPTASREALSDRTCVVGTLNDSAFVVASIERLSLLNPDGQPHPFTVDRTSLITEFDNVISARIAFDLDSSTPTNTSWALIWGTDVTGLVTVADTLPFDAAVSPAPGTFTWTRPGPKTVSGYSNASIEVIADSHANYYALWYLLPMAILFGILSIRKFRIHD